MKPITDIDALDECELVLEGPEYKGAAYWYWKHPDGREFVSLQVDVHGSCWTESVEQLEDGDKVEDYV